MPLTKFIQHGNDELLTNTYLFKYVPVKLGFLPVQRQRQRC